MMRLGVSGYELATTPWFCLGCCCAVRFSMLTELCHSRFLRKPALLGWIATCWTVQIGGLEHPFPSFCATPYAVAETVVCLRFYTSLGRLDYRVPGQAVQCGRDI